MTSKDVELFYNQSMEQLKKGNFEKAANMLDTVLNIDKKFIPAWNGKGVALLEMKEYPKALNCFEKVIQLNAGDNLAWYNKAYVLLLMKEYEKSAQTFEFFRARYEKVEDDFYRYALLMEAQGNLELQKYEKSLLLLEEALKLDKNFIEAQELKVLVLKKAELNNTETRL